MALSGDGGKGYGRRPQLAPNNQVEFNWETIFGTKKPKPVDKDALDAYNEERLVSKYDKANLQSTDTKKDNHKE
jgi:hypothetical protein